MSVSLPFHFQNQKNSGKNMNSYENIGSLSTLLRECRDTEDPSANSTQPPISSSSATVIRSQGGVKAAAVSEPVKDAKSIWDAEEIPSEDTVVAVNKDSRPCPKYEISYKQSIGTEDTFLGLSDKTPLTDNCTHLVRLTVVIIWRLQYMLC
jgi:hypothetical protein